MRARADALIAQMTPEEKAGQITQYFAISLAPEDKQLVTTEVTAGRAGSILFQSDPVELNLLQKIAVEKTRLKIPLLFGYDVIHGFRTIMPVPIAVAASWDPEIAEMGQAVAAAEARAGGLHWVFAPMVDICRDPRWGRMVEGAGEDPCLGSVMAAAQVRGFQGSHIGSPGHVIAGPKHFAGYGAAMGGRDYDEAEISDNELWNVYLPPFKAAIDAGAGNVMSAYMALNGVPAAGNRWLLTDVLRHGWGFKGFVVTDAGAGADLMTHEYASSLADAGVRALKAGVDLEMVAPALPSCIVQSAFKTLPESLAAGNIATEELDNAVRRVLEAKIRMGLFENPYADLDEAKRVASDPRHHTIARIAAERSAVLLHNDGLLPLDLRNVKSIAVIGPTADSKIDTEGPWVLNQNEETVTVLAGIRAKVGSHVRVDFSPGVSTPLRQTPSVFEVIVPSPRIEVDDDLEIQRALAMVRASDVVILILGEPQNMIGESSSRSTLDLPGRQQQLLDAVIATGKPVVVLLMSARPLDLKGSKPQALMVIWYPGTEGGTAVANLLFGDAVPGGKLPFTWPRSVGQVPLPYAHLRSHQPMMAEKRYWNEPSEPLYPFGYGLSYSPFHFSNLRVQEPRVAPGETVSVCVDLKNTGERTADEVVQLYIHQRYGSSARPVRELKGFTRVTMAPGETRTVEFTLRPEDLRYWTATKGAFVQDDTVFDVYVGSDSTASLAASFEVRGGR